MNTLKILVVDDASFIRDLIKRSLRSQLPGVEIDEANDGKRAISLFNKNSYDLILCDWEMPEVSGIEVLKELRQQELAQQDDQTPFIMVTSRGDKSHVTKAVEAGVNDYIGKPFTSDQLLRKAIRQLAKRRKDTLQEMMNKAPKSFQEKARSAAHNSAQTLLGGGGNGAAEAKPAQPARQDMGGAAALTGDGKEAPSAPKAPPVEKLRKGRLKRHVKANLRLPDVTFSASVEDLNLTQVLLWADRTKRLPQLFEQAALDIELGDADRVARLNCFIFSLQATTTDFECDTLLVNVRLTDEDPEKYSELSRFIAKVR